MQAGKGLVWALTASDGEIKLCWSQHHPAAAPAWAGSSLLHSPGALGSPWPDCMAKASYLCDDDCQGCGLPVPLPALELHHQVVQHHAALRGWACNHDSATEMGMTSVQDCALSSPVPGGQALRGSSTSCAYRQLPQPSRHKAFSLYPASTVTLWVCSLGLASRFHFPQARTSSAKSLSLTHLCRAFKVITAELEFQTERC